MVRHIIAIVFIFIATTVAWAILGSTLLYRTYQSDSELRGRVQSTWGAPQEQPPPDATWRETVTTNVETTENGRTVRRPGQVTTSGTLPLERTRARVALDLTHRLKGLRWFSTYKVGFQGAYTFRNTTPRDRRVTFALRFPATQAIYDDLVFSVNGKPVPTEHAQGGTRGTVLVGAGQTALLEVGYRSQGLDRWTYGLRPGDASPADGTPANSVPPATDVAEIRDFELAMTTNFAAIDFPENTLSPTQSRRTPAGSRSGRTERSRAATPATWGLAIDVPLKRE